MPNDTKCFECNVLRAVKATMHELSSNWLFHSFEWYTFSALAATKCHSNGWVHHIRAGCMRSVMVGKQWWAPDWCRHFRWIGLNFCADDNMMEKFFAHRTSNILCPHIMNAMSFGDDSQTWIFRSIRRLKPHLRLAVFTIFNSTWSHSDSGLILISFSMVRCMHLCMFSKLGHICMQTIFVGKCCMHTRIHSRIFWFYLFTTTIRRAAAHAMSQTCDVHCLWHTFPHSVQ